MQTRAQHELLLRMENAVEERVLAALKRTLKPVADTITAAGSNVHALRPRPQVSMDNLSRIHAAWVQEVREELLPLYLEVYAAGAGAAALGLTGTFEIPSVVNVLSEAWLAQASNRLVRIGDVAWEETRTSLLEGFAEGESIPKLASRVRNVIDDTESRARTIARTEVISASNAGSLAGAAQYGAVQKVWLATADSRTRETHLDADGQSVGMDELFLVGDDSLRFPGDPNGSPDEIINCVLPTTYVDAAFIQMAMRSWYEGDVIEIRSSAGEALTVTPNHPILTLDGWIAAEKLVPGDQVVSGTLRRQFCERDQQRMPSTAAEIYDLASVLRLSARKEFPANFHGERRQCEIRVVAEDRKLGLELVPATMEQQEEFVFAATNLARSTFCDRKTSRTASGIELAKRAPSSSVHAHGLQSQLFRGLLGHHKTRGFSRTADLHAFFDQDLSDACSHDVVLLGDGEARHAIAVCSYDVTSITRREYVGHVYNFSTSEGWYISNDIISHNCRCTLIYQTDEGTGDAAVCVPGFVDGTDDPTCAGEDTPSEDLAASGGWDHVHDG